MRSVLPRLGAPRIDLIFPVLPPTLDGIGDYTAHLARTLADTGCNVRILTAQSSWTPIEGVRVERAFGVSPRRATLGLSDAIRRDPPDWAVLQFEQFSYGRWGLNPFLPLALRSIRRGIPSTRLAWMMHEDFVSASSWRFAIMTTWQRLQFGSIGRQMEAIFCSIEAWAERYQRWFPSVPVHHLPVGSNIPRCQGDREALRRDLGVLPSEIVVGVFGSAHPSRQLGFVRAGLDALAAANVPHRVLYVGGDGDQVRRALPGAPLLDVGARPAEEVSAHLAAMDVYCAPFDGGASTRRGSLLAGLQHGLPTVSTVGRRTDQALRAEHESALLLAPDDEPQAFAACVVQLATNPPLRREVGRAAEAFFETTFSWPVIANQLLAGLYPAPVSPDSQPSSSPFVSAS